MTVDIPEIFQQLQLADKQVEAGVAYLMPNLFPKRQLQVQTGHKVGFVSDDLWPVLLSSHTSLQRIHACHPECGRDHRGNQERSRRQLRGTINQPGMTLKRTRVGGRVW